VNVASNVLTHHLVRNELMTSDRKKETGDRSAKSFVLLLLSVRPRDQQMFVVKCIDVLYALSAHAAVGFQSQND